MDGLPTHRDGASEGSEFRVASLSGDARRACMNAHDGWAKVAERAQMSAGAAAGAVALAFVLFIAFARVLHLGEASAHDWTSQHAEHMALHATMMHEM